MFENENLETEVVSENTEQTVEETPEKTYTEAEFNAKLDEVLGKKIARKEAKIRKEYEGKYGRLEEVVKAGVGKDNLDEATDFLAQAYAAKGRAPKTPNYTDKDIEVLARAEADDIIRSGYDEVAEEVDRLSAIGVSKMTAREKAVFKALAEHRQNADRDRELTKIGVGRDVYESDDFKSFAGKFNPNTPITDIYDIYQKTQPKKHYETMGSMKQTPQTGAKDYYTPEEIERLTEDDLDDPKVWEAVRRSMTGR